VKVALLAVALFIAAQQPPAFEVASVKPSAARDTQMRLIWPRGRFSAVNVSDAFFHRRPTRLML
jgi:hypothetical protein